ncbi:MAG: M48 family metalloprotease [Spirochaetia bacterium]
MMYTHMRTVLRAAVIGVLVIAVSACGTVANIGAGIGQATGTLDERQAESIRRTGERAEKSFEDFTPEQEYYVGRSVAATVLENYSEYENEEANEYVASLGNVLAFFSERPSLYAGYSFQILDNDELNAFATPGGHIFVTRGMMRLARNEAELAAILAHEIAHVQESHGLQSIRTSRITAALTSAAITGAQLATNEEIGELTEVFEDSIDDITQTLFTAGYSRSSEEDADLVALEILSGAGYDPRALRSFLEQMQEHWNPDGPGYARTHPSPQDRIDDFDDEISSGSPEVNQRRTERFERFAGDI